MIISMLSQRELELEQAHVELLETCIYTCSSGEMIHLLIHCTFIDTSSGALFTLVTCSHPSIAEVCRSHRL